MTGNNDYSVFHENGQWAAKRDDASRASSVHSTQKDAYEAARGYAERNGGGEVSIHRKDNGEIRDKNTIAPAHDPRGTKG